MNKTELQEWIVNTINVIVNNRTESKLTKAWSTQLTELKQIKSGVEGFDNTISVATQRKAITHVRKHIKDLKPTIANNKLKELALTYANSRKGIKNGIVVMDTATAMQHKQKKETSLNALIQRDNINTITKLQLATIHKTLAGWLSSFDYTERTAAISYFTGRRAIEVLHTGEFKRTTGSKQLKFSGQAKKKSEFEQYKIDTLISPTKVINSVTGLRELIDYKGLSNEAIEHKTNRALGETMYKLFDIINWTNKLKKVNRGTRKGRTITETVADVHFHDLRKLYIATILNGESDRLRIKQLLGHDNLDTGKHYENWRITD